MTWSVGDRLEEDGDPVRGITVVCGVELGERGVAQRLDGLASAAMVTASR